MSPGPRGKFDVGELPDLFGLTEATSNACWRTADCPSRGSAAELTKSVAASTTADAIMDLFSSCFQFELRCPSPPDMQTGCHVRTGNLARIHGTKRVRQEHSCDLQATRYGFTTAPSIARSVAYAPPLRV